MILKREIKKDTIIILTIVVLVLCIITASVLVKNNNTVYDFFKMLFGFDIVCIHIWVFIALLVYQVICYSISLHKDNVIIKNGRQYSATIVDVVEKQTTNNGGFPDTFYLVIQYDGEKKVTSKPYLTNPKIELKDKKCVVHIYKNECVVTEFNLKTEKKVREFESLYVKIEECLIKNIYADDFDSDVFFRKRLRAPLYGKNKYIFPIPLFVVFKDGMMKLVIIDIRVCSWKKIITSEAFNMEMYGYYGQLGVLYTWDDKEEVKRLIAEKVKEVMKKYYRYVKVLSVDVEFI